MQATLQTFDYTKFRAEFVRLKEMTSYQRAMDRAEKIKAAKREEYKRRWAHIYGD